MDPVTHVVAGAAIAALVTPETAGLSPLIPIAVGVVASLTPDLDFITKQISQAIFLRHHHGITHGILPTVVQAALVALIFAAFVGIKFYLLLFIAALAAEATHLMLDMLLHSNGIAIFSPFSERRYSFPILLGVNPISTVAQCHLQNVAVCLLCQLNGAIRNPVPLALFITAVLGVLDFDHLRIYSGVCFCFLAIWYLLAAWTRFVARKHMLKLEEFKGWELLVPFPASFYLIKWLGVFRRDDIYETVLIQLGKRGYLIKHDYGKKLSGLHQEAARHNPFREIFETAAYVPFEWESKEPGGYKITWLDLSHSIDPRVELVAVHIHLDEEGRFLRSAFRERWNPAVED